MLILTILLRRLYIPQDHKLTAVQTNDPAVRYARKIIKICQASAPL